MTSVSLKTLVGLALLAGALLALDVRAYRPHQVKLALEPSKLSLAARQGEIVPFRASLRNDSDYAVQILDVTPSCGCVSAATDGVVIGPHEVGLLRGKFDSSNFPGLSDKQVVVRVLEDPSHPVTLSLDTNTVEVARPVPEYQKVPANGTSNFLLTVRKGIEGIPYRVVDVRCSSPWVTLGPIQEGQEGPALTVYTQPVPPSETNLTAFAEIRLESEGRQFVVVALIVAER